MRSSSGENFMSAMVTRWVNSRSLGRAAPPATSGAPSYAPPASRTGWSYTPEMTASPTASRVMETAVACGSGGVRAIFGSAGGEPHAASAAASMPTNAANPEIAAAPELAGFCRLFTFHFSLFPFTSG